MFMAPLAAAAGTTTGLAATTMMTAGGTMATLAPVAASSFGAGLAATFGSMSAGSLLSMGLSGASTLMQAKLAGDSADAQAAGLQQKALMEGLQAEEQSILRRERLIKALSAQGAQAGASGVRGGSVEALKETSITEFKREQKSADLMASINQSASQRAASSVKKGGKYQAAGTLLSYGQRLAEIG